MFTNTPSSKAGTLAFHNFFRKLIEKQFKCFHTVSLGFYHLNKEVVTEFRSTAEKPCRLTYWLPAQSDVLCWQALRELLVHTPAEDKICPVNSTRSGQDEL